MSAYNNEVPLYKVAKFRRIRQIVNCISKYEKIDMSGYNLENIRCYRAHGSDLNGRNVKTNVKNRRHFLVSNNLYEVYEIPHFSNSKARPYTGNYLVLFYNTSFDYYVFATMNHDMTVKDNIKESTEYYCYGKYEVLKCDASGVKLEKTIKGHDLSVGFGSNTKETPKNFDEMNVRKESGYGVNPKKILGLNHKRFTSGNAKNPIYKKKNNDYRG